jgi:hypothetical protein
MNADRGFLIKAQNKTMKTIITSNSRPLRSTGRYPTKKLTIIGILAAVTMFGAFSVKANNIAYMGVNGGDFGTIDLNTGVFTFLGTSNGIIGNALESRLRATHFRQLFPGRLVRRYPEPGKKRAVGCMSNPSDRLVRVERPVTFSWLGLPV